MARRSGCGLLLAALAAAAVWLLASPEAFTSAATAGARAAPRTALRAEEQEAPAKKAKQAWIGPQKG
eukprot:CAMPEP_0183408630 /NCGR_PEP_ID=MMETSP0370-20130417/18231_1 /TAXON_ID=268820 /ORGANISM="Peridinium aciculiferum, Strain PAER-2" /LENGTH=66 /DNA_ID=CAMNT_0025591175 /DNA_START=50 /DNA_END=247 /DNA_ORIENTATION=+